MIDLRRAFGAVLVFVVLSFNSHCYLLFGGQHDSCIAMIDDFKAGSNPRKTMEVYWPSVGNSPEYIYVKEKDNSGKLIAENKYYCSSSMTWSINADLVNEFTYEYDANDFLTYKIDNFAWHACWKYEYNASGQLIKEIRYSNDPGTDFHFAPSDSVHYYQTYTYNLDSSINKMYDRNIGVDGVWDSGDEAVRSYEEHRYNFNGKDEVIVYFGNAGSDGIWESADDVIWSYKTSYYDASSRLLKQTQTTSSGLDTIWFSTDDEESIYLGPYEYNVSGELTRSGDYTVETIQGTP